MNRNDIKKASDFLYGKYYLFNVEKARLLCTLIILDELEPAFTYTEHAHSFYEFHYVTSGKGCVGINGTEYFVEKGDFYLTGPSILHWQISDTTKPMSEICLRIILKNEEASDIVNSLEKCIYVKKDNGDILSSLERIYSEALNYDKFSEEIINHSLSDFIIRFARYFTFSNSADKGYSQNITEMRMNLINAYIYDNLERNISCDEIAAHIYVCKRQLNRIILKETGLSTHKYLSLLKLNKAKDLILNTNLPLNKIAHITGFSSEFHLSNLIKQHFYSSPKELRNTTKSVEC